MASPTVPPVYPSATTVNGTVSAVNPKGIKLAPQDEWFNLSKWAEEVTMPERGQEVTLTLDKSGFVRGVASTSRAPQPIAGGSAERSEKDRTITRLAVLKAAAEFGASRPELKSGDVLLVAASWERWVLREDRDEDDG